MSPWPGGYQLQRWGGGGGGGGGGATITVSSCSCLTFVILQATKSWEEPGEEATIYFRAFNLVFS